MGLNMHVEKDLGKFKLKIDLDVENDIIGLLGYSGCGKTMTLKMIAGIVTPDRGSIILNGRTLFDSEKKINLKPQQRNIGLMFQSYALFNHMTVYDNIAIGMKGKKNQKAGEIEQYLELLDLTSLKHQKPRTLSGGQKQRVALARILAQNPDILMLDEPFSALDSHLIYTIEKEFKSALQSFKGPVIYISHNRHEIYKYCQWTAVMSEGRLVEFKETRDLFDCCNTVSGARLTGCRNIAKAVRNNKDILEVKEWGLAIDLPAVRQGTAFEYIGVRESDLTVVKEQNNPFHIAVNVEELIMMPDKVKIMFKTQTGYPFTYTCSKREYEQLEKFLMKEKVSLLINPDKLLYLK